MSNIRGLYDDKNDDMDDEERRRRDANNRFVGGIGAQGGGSGLAVEPNNDDGPPSSSSSGIGIGASDSIFNIAERAGLDDANAGAGAADNDSDTTRRTITMYRNGFIVDDGPYRRLDDPDNAEFLTYLARGQTPRELLPKDGNGGNITVGLVDKRKEDYVETFRSFSGGGNALGSSTTTSGAAAAATGSSGEEGADTGIYDPSSLPPPPADPTAEAGETTSIAVRMLDGKRKVIKVRLDGTLVELASVVVHASNTTMSGPFRIVTGFPPKPIPHPQSASVREAGLKGAQIQLQKA